MAASRKPARAGTPRSPCKVALHKCRLSTCTSRLLLRARGPGGRRPASGTCPCCTRPAVKRCWAQALFQAAEMSRHVRWPPLWARGLPAGSTNPQAGCYCLRSVPAAAATTTGRPALSLRLSSPDSHGLDLNRLRMLHVGAGAPSWRDSARVPITWMLRFTEDEFLAPRTCLQAANASENGQ